jgi:hypothetical protein
LIPFLWLQFLHYPIQLCFSSLIFLFRSFPVLPCTWSKQAAAVPFGFSFPGARLSQGERSLFFDSRFNFAARTGVLTGDFPAAVLFLVARELFCAVSFSRGIPRRQASREIQFSVRSVPGVFVLLSCLRVLQTTAERGGLCLTP